MRKNDIGNDFIETAQNNDEIVVINGHEYPSRYPPGINKNLDKAWEILDMIGPGVLDITIRSYLAGAITGALQKAISDAKKSS